VDLVVQSTDKNLLVPVGGSIVCSFDENTIINLQKFYPGRASSSQSLDVLITLLSMGSDNYKKLLTDRKECFDYLKDQLCNLAIKFHEKVLDTPHNSISIGKDCLNEIFFRLINSDLNLNP
jgi:O-phospho-L-seryl-tRNASec:L-selenocysteinyl-tRNA synthase